MEAGPILEEPELLSLPDNADSGQEFRDRSTGLPLIPEMVKKARELEMQCMEELKVLEESDRDACVKRHVDGQQLMWKTGAATFGATPPYEAFKLQLSLMMTGPRSLVEGDDDVLTLLDNFQSTSPLTACKSRVRDH